MFTSFHTFCMQRQHSTSCQPKRRGRLKWRWGARPCLRSGACGGAARRCCCSRRVHPTNTGRHWLTRSPRFAAQSPSCFSQTFVQRYSVCCVEIGSSRDQPGQHTHLRPHPGALWFRRARRCLNLRVVLDKPRRHLLRLVVERSFA